MLSDQSTPVVHIVVDFVASMISKLLPFALLSAQTMAMGKRGLTYEDAAVANLFNDSSEVSWGYNWGFTSKGLDPYLEFTPMLWGLPSGPEPEWMEVLQSNATEHALGFNEPDLGSQANITAAAAAEGHRMYVPRAFCRSCETFYPCHYQRSSSRYGNWLDGAIPRGMF